MLTIDGEQPAFRHKTSSNRLSNPALSERTGSRDNTRHAEKASVKVLKLSSSSVLSQFHDRQWINALKLNRVIDESNL